MWTILVFRKYMAFAVFRFRRAVMQYIYIYIYDSIETNTLLSFCEFCTYWSKAKLIFLIFNAYYIIVFLRYRCYVGNSVEQWRPCSDQYFPSAEGPPLTWPMTYIHNTGPSIDPVTGTAIPSSLSPPLHRTDNNNNGTHSIVGHVQSLVDQFLSLFSSSSTTEANKTADGVAAATSSHFPGFRVVDVTDRSQAINNRAALGSVNTLHLYGTGDRFRNRITKRKPYIWFWKLQNIFFFTDVYWSNTFVFVRIR